MIDKMKAGIWSGVFWKSTLERVIRTIAQAMLALIGTNVVSVTDLDWQQIVLASITAGIVALLTCIVAAGVGDSSSPAFRDES